MINVRHAETRRQMAAALALMSTLLVAHAQKLERGMNRPGTDYRQVELAVADPEACQSECVADTQCRSFSYVKPLRNGAPALCRLKSKVRHRPLLLLPGSS